MSASAPFSDAATRVTQPFADAWGWAAGLVDARQENTRLEEQLARAGEQQVQFRHLEERNRRLEALLNFKQPPGYEKLGASVIQMTPTAYQNHVTVNVGSDDGVRVNDPVVAPAGDGGALIGRVDAVAGGSANVVLLLDPQSSVTARIQGSSAWGVVEPSAGEPGQLNLKLVPVSKHVPRGSVVVTAQLAQPENGPALRALLPPDLPIGRITSVGRSDTSQFHAVQVTPFVDFQDLSDVVVLRSGG
jgi:rod shape-determining protein MreC